MPYIQTKGPTTIFENAAATTKSAGSWYQVHPSLRNLTFQVVQTASSVGATASSTVYIEVTNSTAAGRVATKWLTVALTGTTDTVTDGGSCTGTSMAGPWNYYRANLNSLSSSTVGSAGFPVVTVICNAN